MTTLLSVQDVSKTYTLGDGSTVHAADELSFDVDAGDGLAIVGASGSGKSTLLHMIAGMDKPTSGSIAINGTDMATMSAKALLQHRRQVGFIFQSFNLIGALTVLDNVCVPLSGQVKRKEAVARAEQLLDQVGLADRARSMPAQLSGGQQQRVAIARALIGQPTMVLADEPTGNLDTAAAETVMDLLTTVHTQQGCALLLVTHDDTIAARLPRQIRLRDGAIIETSIKS